MTSGMVLKICYEGNRGSMNHGAMGRMQDALTTVVGEPGPPEIIPLTVKECNSIMHNFCMALK